MAIQIPSATQCLAFAGPFLAVGAMVWFWRHGDGLVARLFPSLEWQRELGWLNLRAHRRADLIMRGLTHALHFCLLGALAGILAFAWLLGQPHDVDSVVGIFSIPFEFICLATCLGIWITYFVWMLAPRIRAEFEREELQRYRAENPDLDEVPRPRDRLAVSVWETGRPRRF